MSCPLQERQGVIGQSTAEDCESYEGTKWSLLQGKAERSETVQTGEENGY